MSKGDDDYTAMVADQIGGQRPACAWAPEHARELRVASVAAPRTIEELDVDARRSLFAIFGSVARLRELLAGAGRHVECARLVDARGVLACIVLTWSYGVSYTFGADGRLLAFGSQHDVEAWNLEQRALFFEIDEALRASTPLHQPLSFAWWDDGLWEELAPGEDRGDPMLAALR